MRAPEKAAGEILKPRWGETIASHAHSALKYVSAATGATPSQPTADRGRHPGEVMAERSPVRTRVSTYRLSICISSLPSNDLAMSRRRSSARKTHGRLCRPAPSPC